MPVCWRQGILLYHWWDDVTLHRSHAYYRQVQTQPHTVDAEYCNFLVWNYNDIFVERILPDMEFSEKVYFHKCWDSKLQSSMLTCHTVWRKYTSSHQALDSVKLQMKKTWLTWMYLVFLAIRCLLRGLNNTTMVLMVSYLQKLKQCTIIN